MDSDEYYNLWAAFMEPDSPSGTPSLTSTASRNDEDDFKDDSADLDAQQGGEGTTQS